jgi:hypothetical protein
VLDLSIFEIEGMRRLIRGQDLLVHRDGWPEGGGVIWFMFGFEGLCGDQLEGGGGLPSDTCSALELLIVEPDVTWSKEMEEGAMYAPPGGGAGCVVGLCVRQGSALWGNSFPGKGVGSILFGLAWGPRSSHRYTYRLFLFKFYVPWVIKNEPYVYATQGRKPLLFCRGGYFGRRYASSTLRHKIL